MSISTFIVPTGPGTLSASGDDTAVSSTGGVVYDTVSGALVADATEAKVKFVVPSPGVLKSAYINVTTNGDTSASPTCTLMKNGVATSIVINITTTTTGLFSDTSNSVIVAAGDLLDWKFSQATTAAIKASSISIGYVTSNSVVIKSKQVFCWAGTNLNSTVGARFIPITSSATAINASETAVQIQSLIPISGTFKNAVVNAVTNGNTVNGTWTFRVNVGTPSNSLVVTVTALTTGFFTDTTNTVNIAPNDLVDWSVSQATTSGTIGQIAVEFDAN